MNLDFKKVDLHLHLDGSLNVDTMYELALMKKLIQPDMSRQDFDALCRVKDNCKSLSEFLARFELPIKLMQDREAISRFAHDLVADLAKQNCCYAEVRFAPQYHCLEGLSQREVVQAVIEGVNQAYLTYPEIKIGLILCMVIAIGYENERENRLTVQVCKEYLGKGVVALDLAGAEGAQPMEKYAELFKEAECLGIPFTIHAGECGTYENVIKALNLHCRRVGHGQAAIDHVSAIQALKDQNVAIDLCVTSNIQCQVRPSFEEHPIRKLFEAGIKITINTDNMTISNTTLLEEYQKLVHYYGFTREDLIQFNLNSIEYSFMEEELKASYQELIKHS